MERLEASSPTVSAVFLPLLWSGVSIAPRRAGRPDEARDAAQRGIAEARRMGTRTYECAAQIALAEALLSGTREDAQAVEAALARTEVLIDATGGRGFVPLVVAARSKLAGATGDRVQGG